ncbi:7545_t:CDS:2, partial [Entrophospora sp. SA101]
KTIRGDDFFIGLPYLFKKSTEEVHFWRKDIIEKDYYVREHVLKPVETYNEEGKKLLEVQKKFMEECEDCNKECSLYMKKSKIFIEEINKLSYLKDQVVPVLEEEAKKLNLFGDYNK